MRGNGCYRAIYELVNCMDKAGIAQLIFKTWWCSLTHWRIVDIDSRLYLQDQDHGLIHLRITGKVVGGSRQTIDACHNHSLVNKLLIYAWSIITSKAFRLTTWCRCIAMHLSLLSCHSLLADTFRAQLDVNAMMDYVLASLWAIHVSPHNSGDDPIT